MDFINIIGLVASLMGVYSFFKNDARSILPLKKNLILAHK